MHQTNKPLSDCSALSLELDWLHQCVLAWVLAKNTTSHFSTFSTETYFDVPGICAPSAPEFIVDDVYSSFVNANRLSADERLALILSLSPYLDPLWFIDLQQEVSDETLQQFVSTWVLQDSLWVPTVESFFILKQHQSSEDRLVSFELFSRSSPLVSQEVIRYPARSVLVSASTGLKLQPTCKTLSLLCFHDMPENGVVDESEESFNEGSEEIALERFVESSVKSSEESSEESSIKSTVESPLTLFDPYHESEQPILDKNVFLSGHGWKALNDFVSSVQHANEMISNPDVNHTPLTFNHFVFYGATGTGKTFTLSALAKFFGFEVYRVCLTELLYFKEMTSFEAESYWQEVFQGFSASHRIVLVDHDATATEAISCSQTIACFLNALKRHTGIIVHEYTQTQSPLRSVPSYLPKDILQRIRCDIPFATDSIDRLYYLLQFQFGEDYLIPSFSDCHQILKNYPADGFMINRMIENIRSESFMGCPLREKNRKQKTRITLDRLKQGFDKVSTTF